MEVLETFVHLLRRTGKSMKKEYLDEVRLPHTATDALGKFTESILGRSRHHVTSLEREAPAKDQDAVGVVHEGFVD
jgi:hypothetical protein